MTIPRSALHQSLEAVIQAHHPQGLTVQATADVGTALALIAADVLKQVDDRSFEAFIHMARIAWQVAVEQQRGGGLH